MASAESTYHEAFDQAGQLRDPYRAFHARTGQDVLHPSAESRTALGSRPLGDAYTILPIPLILDDAEYGETIVAGVRQRALALQALFADLVSGDARVFRDTGLPPDLFAHVVKQEGIGLETLRRWWAGKSREAVRFIHAPDLVRAPAGQWLVLEDNVGCVGGVVDGHLVVERFLAHTGMKVDGRVPSGSDLARAVSRFLERVGKSPQATDVVALMGASCGGDTESNRKRAALQELGMRVLDPRELDRGEVGTARGPRLRIRDIGAVVNFEAGGSGAPSELIDELFGQRGVPFLTAPATNVLGNKALLPFVDDIVAAYSGREPILRTATTEACRALPEDPAGWVIKRSTGCQGGEVFFLDELTADERSALASTLQSWGDAGGVRQRRVCASVLSAERGGGGDRFQVELRPVAFVVGDGQCHVGDHPSGRAFTPAPGRRLGNMSRGAHYLPVIREPVRQSGRGGTGG